MKITIDNSFTLEQKQVINDCLLNAKSKVDLSDKLLTLEIKNSGRLKTTAGNAQTNRNKKLGIIKMNKRLFSSTAGIKEFTNTFGHELAHILANVIKDKSCGHNYYWKYWHRELGGNAKVTHNYDVEHLRAKGKKFEYKCNCSTHKISTRRHNRILKGASYSCRNCKSTIKIRI